MTPYEMMLSESQERMLMVLKPGREAEAEAIFRKWELDFAVIGRVTETGHMVLRWNGEIVCDIPLAPLADEAPLYDRPALSPDEYKAWAQVKPLGEVPHSTDIAADLLKLMGSPDLASRRWIWEQYDHMVGADTVQRPGGDAAVVRVHGTQKALAISTDVTPRYCYADPYEGGQAGDRRMLSQPLRGRRDAARRHQLPQLRQSAAAGDHGAAGGLPRRHGRRLPRARLPDRLRQRLPLQRKQGHRRRQRDPADACDRRRRAAEGLAQERHARLQGGRRKHLPDREGRGHLGQSLWLRYVAGQEAGTPPPVDLERERRTGEFVRQLISDGKVSAVHDVADGGLLVAVAEMALAANIGAKLEGIEGTAAAFGEDQGLYVVTAPAGASWKAPASKSPASAGRAAARSKWQVTASRSKSSAARMKAFSPSSWAAQSRLPDIIDREAPCRQQAIQALRSPRSFR
jgi:phosphoribosylformylglycinamidine synthase